MPIKEHALPSVTLVLGGARSGKSRWAEDQITAGFETLWTGALYLATAEPGDAEMAARIADHQARRGERWETVECPIGLPRAILEHTKADRPILVDCLTLWLSNLMLTDRDVTAMTTALLGTLNAPPGPVILVSNEVGLGIVPDTELGRRFRDAQGRLNQQVSAVADRVVFLAAGLPLVLKDGKPSGNGIGGRGNG